MPDYGDSVDRLHDQARVRSLDVVGVVVFLFDLEVASPDAPVVAHDPLTHSSSGVFVADLGGSPHLDGSLVVRVVEGIDELDLIEVAHRVGHRDRVLFLHVLGVDRQDLHLFVCVVMAGSVSLLKLYRNSVVVVAAVLQHEALD